MMMVVIPGSAHVWNYTRRPKARRVKERMHAQ